MNTRRYQSAHGVTCNIARLSGVQCDNSAVLIGYAYCRDKSIPVYCHICYTDIESFPGSKHTCQLCEDCINRLQSIDPSNDICANCSNKPVNLFDRDDKECVCYRTMVSHAQYSDTILLCREHQKTEPAKSKLRMISHYNELLNKLTRLYCDTIYYDDYMTPYESEYLYDGIVKIEHKLGLSSAEGQSIGQIVKLFKPSY